MGRWEAEDDDEVVWVPALQMVVQENEKMDETIEEEEETGRGEGRRG